MIFKIIHIYHNPKVPRYYGSISKRKFKSDPELYKMTLDPNVLLWKFFNNKFSIGQYPGYTHNNYLDRTRYIKSDEPLPVNPDFFIDNWRNLCLNK